MSLFSDLEKTIERGFSRWTERVFGKAEAGQLLLAHRAILEEILGKVTPAARGRRVFPYPRVIVKLASPDAEQRAIYHAAFAEGGRLESDVREALEAAECEIPRGFSVEALTVETAGPVFEIEYGTQAAEPQAAAAPPEPLKARLLVTRGKAAQSEYALERPRVNIGRLEELTDAEYRVVRRNDIVFEDGADEANATVSRAHAHISRDQTGFRICDDESEFGTRVFREGRSIEVPAGNRRGEKLKPGDEIYLGRACMRFEA
jgi:hypothetical protein